MEFLFLICKCIIIKVILHFQTLTNACPGLGLRVPKLERVRIPWEATDASAIRALKDSAVNLVSVEMSYVSCCSPSCILLRPIYTQIPASIVTPACNCHAAPAHARILLKVQGWTNTMWQFCDSFQTLMSVSWQSTPGNVWTGECVSTLSAASLVPVPRTTLEPCARCVSHSYFCVHLQFCVAT